LAQFIEPPRRLGNCDGARIVGILGRRVFGVSPSGKGKVSKLVVGL
jgi:hypothetical protein